MLGHPIVTFDRIVVALKPIFITKESYTHPCQLRKDRAMPSAAEVAKL
jgi:hypothetical protein